MAGRFRKQGKPCPLRRSTITWTDIPIDNLDATWPNGSDFTKQQAITIATWQASSARHKFSDIIDAAVAGQPQFAQRSGGKEVVVVSRDYFDSTKANLKTFLLNEGYSGPGEDEFDAILADVRADAPDFLRRWETED